MKIVKFARACLGFVSPVLDSVISPVINWFYPDKYYYDPDKWTKRLSRLCVLGGTIAFTLGLVGSLVVPIPGFTPVYLATTGWIASQLGVGAAVAGAITGILTVGGARVLGTAIGALGDYIRLNRTLALAPIETVASNQEMDNKKEKKFKIGKGCRYIKTALGMMFIGETALRREQKLSSSRSDKDSSSSPQVASVGQDCSQEDSRNTFKPKRK